MTPALLEIITPMPTSFFNCLHCEQIFDQAGIGQNMRQAELERHTEDLQEAAARLESWLEEAIRQHRARLHIRIVDPASPEGLAFSMRYWAQKYPTFLINRRIKVVGWRHDALFQALDETVTGHPARNTANEAS
ncbi:MAG TPA: hypothetical protein ENL35_06465 [Chloroflexi bacterium]|nr:hypothetical protein [Chloroflexota bacterium]